MQKNDMKHEKDRKGFWKGVLGLVIDNWGLKVLALILAIVIYYAIKPEADPSVVPSERIKFAKVEAE